MPGPHKKKTKGARVKKRKADSGKKAFRAEKGAAGGDSGLGGGADAATDKAARQRNPKAFVFSGSGKAKKSAARTAEREQRRMHGEAEGAEHTGSAWAVPRLSQVSPPREQPQWQTRKHENLHSPLQEEHDLALAMVMACRQSLAGRRPNGRVLPAAAVAGSVACHFELCCVCATLQCPWWTWDHTRTHPQPCCSNISCSCQHFLTPQCSAAGGCGAGGGPAGGGADAYTSITSPFRTLIL